MSDSSRDALRALRLRAQERLGGQPSEPVPLTHEGAIEELAVHKAELEMQNEELRESRLALEASRRSFAELFLLAPVSYFVLDPAGTIEDVNLAGAELLDFSRSRLAGKPFAIFVDSQTVRPFTDGLRGVTSGEGGWRGELLLRTMNGREAWVLAEIHALDRPEGGTSCLTAVWDVTPQKKAAEELVRQGERLERSVAERTAELREANAVLAHEVAERKKAEEEARQTMRFSRATLDALAPTLCVLEEDGRIVATNAAWRAFAEKNGSGPGRVGEGVNYLGVCDAAEGSCRFEAIACAEGIRSVLRGEREEFSMEYPCHAPHVRRWFLCRVTPFRGEGPPRAVVMHTDITARVLGEMEIRRLNAELESRVVERTAELQAALSEMEAFSYSVSHDLRAPVRAIDGFARLLEEHTVGTLDGEGRRLLATVRRSSLRMGHLIDDLLAFARAGRAELKWAEIDAGHLVKEVLADVLSEEQRERFEVRVADLPRVWGDRTLLRQLVLNLLENAVKFSAPVPEPVVEVGSREVDGFVELFVRDNGVGFDQKYAGKLFGVFQRLHSEKEFPGTGIGLSLVRRIVERHGGRYRAEGVVGQGATFYFCLGKGKRDPGTSLHGRGHA